MQISVKVRQSKKADSKVAAFADVTLELPDGKIELRSFSIFRPNGKPTWIAAPASRGTTKFFPFYALSGEIRKNVERAVLAEYQRDAKVPI